MKKYLVVLISVILFNFVNPVVNLQSALHVITNDKRHNNILRILCLAVSTD